jgi:hypothetical protein
MFCMTVPNRTMLVRSAERRALLRVVQDYDAFRALHVFVIVSCKRPELI